MTCTGVFKSRILLPNSPSSILRAWTNPAGQIQQVTNHGIFSKYFILRKQNKTKTKNKTQNQATNSDKPLKALFKKKKLVGIFWVAESLDKAESQKSLNELVQCK